jgi:hypothetical protein
MVHNATRRFERSPLTEQEKKIVGDVDYASGLTAAKSAINQLNELVPDGNAELTEVEFERLQRGVAELGTFLSVRGCKVANYLSPSQVEKLVNAAVIHARLELANEVFPLVEGCVSNGIQGVWLDNASKAIALAIREGQPAPTAEAAVENVEGSDDCQTVDEEATHS